MQLLVKLREESGFKTSRVMRETGLSRTTLYHKERGHSILRQDELDAFARIYKISANEIKEWYEHEGTN